LEVEVEGTMTTVGIARRLLLNVEQLALITWMLFRGAPGIYKV
jgi:hypothetical protein